MSYHLTLIDWLLVTAMYLSESNGPSDAEGLEREPSRAAKGSGSFRDLSSIDMIELSMKCRRTRFYWQRIYAPDPQIKNARRGPLKDPVAQPCGKAVILEK